VRAHPQFGLFVHGVGADLHFQHLALGADHRRVQRAVAVFLGVGDVVVELLGDVPPQGVDDAQRGVAVAHFRDQHAHGAHVVDLAEGQALALHFAPDRIDVFGPAADVGVDAGGLQLARNWFITSLMKRSRSSRRSCSNVAICLYWSGSR
jgi:hypothetical protein